MFGFGFKQGSHFVAQAGLELVISVPYPPTVGVISLCHYIKLESAVLLLFFLLDTGPLAFPLLHLAGLEQV